ncbi:SpaA isopeptide-forming pilin-related protein [Lacticaseibacillus absianus]|uniref:SpaA isopeptide-forming pilin-related protein n=1 Tax=Lacticaseibacillus absianus TaxID=2729623 RepID=UPI0015CDF7F3|nr:SpaA isopeptide-forming pilin-related protein [Lacticaseibacillus absianus]
MKAKKRVWSVALLCALLIPYLVTLWTSWPRHVQAVDTTQQTLVSNDKVQVKTAYEVKGDAINWTITYAKNLTDGRTGRLKFKSEATDQVAGKDWLKVNDWVVEKDFTAKNQGQLQVTVPKTTPTVRVTVQLDEQEQVVATAEDTEDDGEAPISATTELMTYPDQLSTAEAGPHTLTAEIPADKPTTEAPKVEAAADDATDEKTSAAQPVVDVAEELANAGVTQAQIRAPRISTDTEETELYPLSATDPYVYTDLASADGQYPKHYYEGEASSNVRNYDYSKAEDAEDPEASKARAMARLPFIWSEKAGGQTFADGFLDYNSAGLRKWATADETDPNKFNITLEAIGNEHNPMPEVDIVLVMDKSPSMSGSNNDQLIEAVNAFIDTVMERKEKISVRIGMVAFRENHNTVVTEFSDDEETLRGSDALNATPGGATGMTFGLKSATDLFATSARQDATKYLIFFGDGGANRWHTPTYGATKYPNTGGLLMQNFGTVPSGATAITASDGYYTDYSNAVSSGGGAYGNSDSMIATTGYVHYLRAEYEGGSWTDQGITPYAVGYKLGNEGAVTSWYAANTLTNIAGDPDRYMQTADAGELKGLFEKLAAKVTKTVMDATIVDPLSQYVDLIGTDVDSFKISSFKLTEDGYADAATAHVKPEFDAKTQTFTLSQVDLGTNEGIRIEYSVSLKADYRNSKFYPANEATYLVNGGGDAEKERAHFAVPSLRAAPDTVDFTLTKEIAKTNIALGGVTFQLARDKDGQDLVGAPVTSSEDEDDKGTLQFTGVEPGDYWLHETDTPDGFQKIDPIQISVSADGAVTGLEGDEHVIENALKPIDLKLIKTDGQAPLGGATFVLQQDGKIIKTFDDANGVQTLTDVQPGTYQVVETVGPEGYDVLGEIGTLEIGEDGQVTYTIKGQAAAVTVNKKGARIKVKLPEVANTLKDYQLQLKKMDLEDNAPLKGAQFALYEVDPSAYPTAVPVATATSEENGLGVFVTEAETAYGLKVGQTYYVKETHAPDGYDDLAGVIQITVTGPTTATLNFSGEAGMVKLGSVATTTAGLNTISFKAYNRPAPAILPVTGGPGLQGLMAIAMTIMMIAGGAWLWMRRPGMEVR